MTFRTIIRRILLYALAAPVLPAALAGQPPPASVDRAPLDTVLITFEEFADTVPAAADSSRDRVVPHPGGYRSVRFPGLRVLDLGGIPRYEGLPRSGRHLATLCVGIEHCRDSVVTLDFDEPQRLVRIWVGALYVPERIPVLMRAYDRDGNEVASDRATITRQHSPRIQVPLSSAANANAISRVLISSVGSGWRFLVIDDLEYVRALPPPPPPQPGRTVPGVVGQPLAVAESLLREARLEVGTVKEAVGAGQPGTVSDQDPAGGVPADGVGSVDLVVIAKPLPPRVPPRPSVWPGLLGGALIVLAMLLQPTNPDRTRRLMHVSPELVETGLGSRSATVREPNPLDLTIRFTVPAESLNEIEHAVREREEQ
ncbi:MAG: PASTA domain-containing protein [Actinomycetota bacterium]